jgi:hypothetical protein
MLCGVAPIPASSGKTTRHRLNRARIVGLAGGVGRTGFTNGTGRGQQRFKLGPQVVRDDPRRLLTPVHVQTE